MKSFRVIFCAISIVAALAEIIDQTNIEVCVYTDKQEDELSWDLEFEGYKSQG